MGPTIITLPQQLDGATAAALRASLLAARGGPVALDGSGVTRFGALGLQVLLAAARTWSEDTFAFELSDPSPALEQGLRQLGATPALTAADGAATQ
ncbi:MAG: STAS domain-containing protein [Caulobacter sp.]|jgi:chemotaxis protein CheX